MNLKLIDHNIIIYCIIYYITLYMCVYIYIYIYKPYGNCKPNSYNRYTYTKKERNPNVTLTVIIKSQRKRRGDINNQKQNKTKQNPKQKLQKKIKINKMARSIYLSITTLNVNVLNPSIKT